MSRRRIDHAIARADLLAGRGAGLTLRAACGRAGVHPATACRWMAADVEFAGAMYAAERAARMERYGRNHPARRPRVAWHPECPVCRSGVEVRRVAGVVLAFWRCCRWPRCLWASWRPRHPQDCPVCQGPRLWSFSRKSAYCRRCRVRTYGHGSTRPGVSVPAVPPSGETR